MISRLDSRQKLDVYALLLPPRPMLAYTLLQVNPQAAHAFAEDAELDARHDRIYNRSRPATHCRDKPPGRALRGLDFYTNQCPQSVTRIVKLEFINL
jgi:proline iminopeptidase